MGLVAGHVGMIESKTDADGWALNGIADICAEVARGLVEIEGHKQWKDDEPEPA